jgi:hypothetical protein
MAWDDEKTNGHKIKPSQFKSDFFHFLAINPLRMSILTFEVPVIVPFSQCHVKTLKIPHKKNSIVYGTQ